MAARAYPLFDSKRVDISISDLPGVEPIWAIAINVMQKKQQNKKEETMSKNVHFLHILLSLFVAGVKKEWASNRSAMRLDCLAHHFGIFFGVPFSREEVCVFVRGL